MFFSFSPPLPGEMIQIWLIFSKNGLKAPTRRTQIGRPKILNGTGLINSIRVSKIGKFRGCEHANAPPWDVLGGSRIWENYLPNFEYRGEVARGLIEPWICRSDFRPCFSRKVQTNDFSETGESLANLGRFTLPKQKSNNQCVHFCAYAPYEFQ